MVYFGTAKVDHLFGGHQPLAPNLFGGICARRLIEFGQQALEVKRLIQHRHIRLGSPIPSAPVARLAVPGQFDAVEIGVVQVQGLVRG